jgi:hypothetical protein
LQFCALRFCPSESYLERTGNTDPSIILLAIKNARTLSFYVHRAFDQRTAGPDFAYMHELIPDLVDRSRYSPDAVFRQLANLSVGPLLTDEVGVVNLAKNPVKSLYPDLRPFAKKSLAALTLAPVRQPVRS